MRIGHGYDAHRFATQRELVLGGVNIPYEMGLAGHSDADVLTHAVMDSLLGALAMGDIGKHFADTEKCYENIYSISLLEQVVQWMEQAGYAIGNLDITLIAQMPKLAPYLEEMKTILGNTCNISMNQVNIKATTEEKMGFTGRLEGISCHCVALLKKSL